jgi:hypothetical protein
VSTPISTLIASLKASDGLSGVSVHGVRGQVVPDAIVIRPDEPWLEPDTFCDFLQHYLAIMVVRAAANEDGVDTLYAMALAIVDALPESWEFVSVGSPIIDESTGTAFLAAPLRLNYKGAQ